MRKIKFRCYDPDLKQWYEAELTPNLGWEVIEKSSRESKYTTNDSIKDWQQYTGLKDKNGVEIYEGDICKYYDSEPDDLDDYETSRGDYDGGWHDVELIGAVEYINDGFRVGGTRWWSKVEVIGNIYENPELLK